jgi:hypothetical protein
VICLQRMLHPHEEAEEEDAEHWLAECLAGVASLTQRGRGR